MDKKKSIMGDLHKLEYRPGASNSFNEVRNASVDSLPSNNSDIPSRQTIPAPQKSDTEFPVASELQTKNNEDVKTAKLLKEAMLRRIDDYRMTRRDLISRITSAQAEMDRDIAEMKRVLSEVDAVNLQLSAQLEELKKMPDLQDSDAADQTLVGAQSHKLEEMRLAIIRTIVRAERPAVQQDSQSSSPSQQINLDSVTMGQILRYGFGLTLPLLIVLILVAALIGVAIIGAFSGSIRW